jgi:DNA-binding NarL/FixJ family response regulator
MEDLRQTVAKALQRHPMLWTFPDMTSDNVKELARQLADAALAAIPRFYSVQKVTMGMQERVAEVGKMKAVGLSHGQIALKLDLTVRQVQRASEMARSALKPRAEQTESRQSES